jgi:hypothetical protein
MWNAAEWDIYGHVARKLGLKWGGDFILFKEKPHNEVALKISWKEVNAVRLAKGMDSAIEYIKGNLI